MSTDTPWARYQHARNGHGAHGPGDPHVELYGALWLVALDDGRIVIGTLNASAMKSLRTYLGRGQ